jgi:hypothetical protein
MAKGREDQLFELIKSLDSTERRYLTREFDSLGTRKAHNYQKLYEIYSDNRFHGAEALAEALKESDLPKHVAVLRHQCFNWIMGKLRTLYNQKGLDARIRSTIHDAEILFDKSLFSIARKRVMAALKLMDEHERWEFAPEIYRMLAGLELSDTYQEPEGTVENLSSLAEEFSKYHDAIGKLASIRSLAHQLVLLQHVPEAKDTIEVLGKDPLLTGNLRELGPRTELYAQQCRGTLAVLSGRINDGDEAFSRMVDLYRLHEYLVADKPENYFITLHNHCLVALHLGKQIVVEKALDDLRIVFSRMVEEEDAPPKVARYLLYYFGARFASLIEFSESEGFQRYVRDFEMRLRSIPLPRNINNGPTLNQLYLNIAVLYFYHGDFPRANKWLNRIFPNVHETAIREVVRRADALHLIILHLKGQGDLVDGKLNYFRRTYPDLAEKDRFSALINEAVRQVEFRGAELGPDLRVTLLRKLEAVGEDAAVQPFFDLNRWPESE